MTDPAARPAPSSPPGTGGPAATAAPLPPPRRAPDGRDDENLIADIYRAGAGLQDWSAVLERLASRLGRRLHLRIVGVRRDCGDCLFALGAPWHGQAPVGAPPERPLLRKTLCEDREATALLEVTGEAGLPAFSERDEARLARFAPHLASALQTARRLQHLEAGAAAGQFLLERTPRPSVLLGDAGSILLANAAARRLLDAGTVLTNQTGRLAAAFEAADARLQSALANAAATLPAGRACRTLIELRDTSCERPVPACLWHLARGADSIAASRFALLVLSGQADRAACDPSLLAALFGFTPAEARVACRLVRNEPPKVVASMLGLSLPTVRHHIRQLRAKTGARDLRELACQLTLAQELCNP